MRMIELHPEEQNSTKVVEKFKPHLWNLNNALLMHPSSVISYPNWIKKHEHTKNMIWNATTLFNTLVKHPIAVYSQHGEIPIPALGVWASFICHRH